MPNPDGTLNKEERARLFEQTDDLHELSRRFHEHMETCREGIDEKDRERGLLYAGYDAIEAAEAFAKENSDIRVIHIDDAVFCNATLVLIPHRTTKHGPETYEAKWMGVTVITIPQCTTITSNFFLYPFDHDGLLDALRFFQEMRRPYMKDDMMYEQEPDSPEVRIRRYPGMEFLDEKPKEE